MPQIQERIVLHVSLNVKKHLCARASGSRARALTRVVPCLSLRVCFGLSEESVYSMARHPYGRYGTRIFSSVRAAWFLKKKLSGFMADLRPVELFLSALEWRWTVSRLRFFLPMYVARDTNSTPG